MPPQTYILLQERDRRFALVAVQRAKIGMQVRISRPTRTSDQNALLHAQLTDVAAQMVWPPPPFANNGEAHDLEWWKRRCTLQWLIDLKQEVEVVTGLEGEEFGLLVPHTSDLTTEQCSSLSEWIWSYGAQHGVVFKEPKREPEPPPPEPGDYR